MKKNIWVREGGIFKNGYHEEIDKLRQAKTEGKDWLANLEAKEKEHTGIKNLRIKYNKVFGYYFEVTKSFLDQVPENWIRKQTLTNAERYTTNELKEMEDVILGAEDRLYNLEYAVFCELRDKIFGQMKRIQDTASVIAFLDMLASLERTRMAQVRKEQNHTNGRNIMVIGAGDAGKNLVRESYPFQADPLP